MTLILTAFIPIDTDSGNTGLVTVRMTAEHLPFIFVIDTGSNVSHILTSSAMMLLNTKEEVIESVETEGINGNIRSVGRIHGVFHSGMFAFEIDLLESDLGGLSKKIAEAGGPEIDGILGTDFLRKYRCHLDFKKNRLHLG